MPNTVNLGLDTPNTGDKPGAWGTATVNSNMQVIDGISCGLVSVALTAANVSLTIATGVIGTGTLTPGSGPTQSANKVINFTGTLGANVTITFPRPGEWHVKNNCGGNFTLTARAPGTGNVIGLPPGELVTIWCDGTNVEFVNLGRVGEIIYLPVSSEPSWITACTVKPYLVCATAAVHTASLYPALNTMFGSTYGGNGITTFAVPPLGNRIPLSLGSLITTSAGGIDGNTLGRMSSTSAGVIGTSNLPANVPYTDNGHFHYTANSDSDGSGSNPVSENEFVTRRNSVGSEFSYQLGGSSTTPSVGRSSTATTSIAISPNSPNTPISTLQPTLIYGMALVRAG